MLRVNMYKDGALYLSVPTERHLVEATAAGFAQGAFKFGLVPGSHVEITLTGNAPGAEVLWDSDTDKE